MSQIRRLHDTCSQRDRLIKRTTVCQVQARSRVASVEANKNHGFGGRTQHGYQQYLVQDVNASQQWCSDSPGSTFSKRVGTPDLLPTSR